MTRGPVETPPSTPFEVPRPCVPTGGDPRVLIFDIELAQSPSPENGGWGAARRGDLGISCAVVWDQRPHIYGPETLDKLAAHLNTGDLLVGYNSREFDIPVIEGATGISIDRPQYDILQAIWSVRGKCKGFKLGDVCERTLGLKKSGTGEGAPKLMSEGRFMEMADYCLNDVWITKCLYNHILREGYVLDPDNNQLFLPVP